MSFMFSHRYVYDSWVKLDVIGLNVQHTRRVRTAWRILVGKTRKKETSWKMYGVHQRFMLSGSYRNEELKIEN